MQHVAILASQSLLATTFGEAIERARPALIWMFLAA
jgi:hypothetical protein